MAYDVVTTEEFDKQVLKKHRDKKDQLKSVRSKLELFPDKYGKPLRGRLSGTWQIRLGSSFRIWYEINEDEKKVILKSIYHKKEAERRY